jgi:Amt family ammonium transporter
LAGESAPRAPSLARAHRPRPGASAHTRPLSHLFSPYSLPRSFDAEGKPVPMPGHSTVLQVLGVFILWLCWYGFNGGSTLAVFIDAPYARDMARVCVTTTLAAASSALTSVMLVKVLTHVWDVTAVGNGVLAGLVSITAPCVVVDPWAAIIIGMIGGLVLTGSSKLMLKLKIDDPLDAFSVHGACGMWGVLSVGIFCRPEYSYNGLGSHGFVYPGPTPDLIGVQIVLILIVILWVGTMSLLIFGGLRLLGILRVPAEIEEAGMDVSKHGGDAYDLSVPPKGKLAA